MAKLRVLDEHGDTAVEWDVRRAEIGDPEAEAAIREAERIFEAQRAKGARAFRVTPGEPAQPLKQFDRMAEEIVMVPRFSGG